MATTLHFIDVGQGNMTLMQLDNGTVMLYDCNVTDDNETKVINYLGTCIGYGTCIDVFINSHRDADHMRGVQKIQKYFPIQQFWDSGVTGNTTDSNEYIEYMSLRRSTTFPPIELEQKKYDQFGKSILRVLNSKSGIGSDTNSQSIVLSVEHLCNRGSNRVILAGDTDAKTWKENIMPKFSAHELSAEILLGSHHGSDSFFELEDNSIYEYKQLLASVSYKKYFKQQQLGVGRTLLNGTGPNQNGLGTYLGKTILTGLDLTKRSETQQKPVWSAKSVHENSRNNKIYYEDHIKCVSPAMTVLSVGNNPHGHPDKKAIEFYTKHSRGSNKGSKVLRTDIHGTMKLVLNDTGRWKLSN